MTMSDNDSKSTKVTAITGVLQLLVLVLGVAALFSTIGAKDAELKEATSDITQLKEITSDLVKAQVLLSAKAGEFDRRLEDILDRLARLESR